MSKINIYRLSSIYLIKQINKFILIFLNWIQIDKWITYMKKILRVTNLQNNKKGQNLNFKISSLTILIYKFKKEIET